MLSQRMTFVPCAIARSTGPVSAACPSGTSTIASGFVAMARWSSGSCFVASPCPL
jgi:hypothetical protein